MLWIEPSAACNLDCAGCPTASGRLGGTMSLERCNEMLGKIPRSIKLFNMWHRGEPLAASHFPEMIAEATLQGIKTHTHSNGILLSRQDTAERIVKAKLTQISIGVDGADQDEYAAYRIGGKLTDVEAGVRALVEARSQLRSKHPSIIIECLLGGQTLEQLRSIKTMAMGWGVDSVKYKTLRVTELNSDSAVKILPENRKLWRYKDNNGHLHPKRLYSRCLRVMWSAVIAWNGDVLPCCFDAEGEFVMGNIFSQSWDSIWRSEKFKQFRKRVMCRNGKPSMCNNCTEGLRRLYIPERQVIG
jgi:radical SAM protein with 4Fe4S-binding SPASM domain